MKFQVKNLWAIFIVIQILFGTGTGLLLLSATKINTEIVSVSTDEITLDDVSIEHLRDVLSDYYTEKIENGEIKIEIDGIPFSVPYQDIDVNVDLDKTIENIKSRMPENGFEMLFSEAVVYDVTPVFTYNSGKLIRRCEELLSHYKTEPVKEKYEIENGTLTLIPGIPGLSIDYVKLEQELKNLIFVPAEPYRINLKDSPVIIKTMPEPIYKETFNTLVSKSNVEFDPNLSEKAAECKDSINNVIIDNSQEFRLDDILDFSRFSGDMEKDLLNRIATVVYQAALPMDGIKVLNRRPAQRAVSYAEPGLEAVIEGEGANLIFRNETGKPLLLLSEIIADRFNVFFASTGEITTGTLTVEKRDFVPPSVITVVNNSLPPNVTRVISEGVPGYTAYVTRTINGKTEEISRDKYQPVSRTVETGAKPVSLDSK
ncbi:MAG: hypothetical protein GX022_09395 [Clostridiaceae bacterium]|nr:hypothetical protein [Clostridiaceae bacterium]